MDDKPRGPGFAYLFFLAIVILIAWNFAQPLGLYIQGILQSVVDAFNNR